MAVVRSWIMDSPTPSWPIGDGEMAGRIRAFGWPATPLGPMADWPRTLTATIDLALAHPFPMAILWGPDALVLYNDAYRSLLGGDDPVALGRPLAETWPEFDRLAAPLLARVRSGETITVDDASFVDAERRETGWYTLALCPVRDEFGVIFAVLATMVDITARVQAERALREKEAHKSLLLSELQHRVRNVLGIVRSLVGRSLQNAQSLEDAADHLEGRLSALARTQSTLIRTVGLGVDLEMLIRDELVAQAVDDDHFTLEGPPVELSPRPAEVLTLAIHELATNALKYGAFASAKGRLAVRWRVIAAPGAEDELDLVWEESGVRVLGAAPRREGFGHELLTRRVPYDLRGTTAYELRVGGAFFQIRFALHSQSSVLQTEAPKPS